MVIKKITSYPLRHGLSVGLTLMIAIIASHFFAWSQQGWMIISAFLVCQASRGSAVREGILFGLLMSVAAMTASMLKIFLFVPWLDLIICTMLGVCLWINYRTRLQKNNMGLAAFIFLLSFVLIFYSPQKAALNLILLDIMIGSLLGVLLGYFIFAVNLYQEFTRALIPILNSLYQYAESLAGGVANEKLRANVIQALQQQYTRYPEWVFVPGFSPGLRGGFRFFLIKLEKLIEVNFVISLFFDKPISSDCFEKIRNSLEKVLKRNADLLRILLSSLRGEKPDQTQADYISDLAELEEILNNLIPADIELLDISPDYVILTSLVRDVRDARQLLLDLLEALPS